VTLAVGTKLGPYELIGLLGAGGMGEVYKARDTRLNRTVAIKVLPSHLNDSPELRQRFEREAQAVAALEHPHICTLHDVGEAPVPADAGSGSGPAAVGAGFSRPTLQFLVMEYLDGETLARRLERGAGSAGPALSLDEVLRYAIEIGDALDTAHRRGIVHRDLKPGNIMLVHRGGASAPPIAKLLDFGLAKLRSAQPGVEVPTPATTRTSPLTSAGRIVGTLQYMAPEQLEGRDADARTDLFAFGAILYEMATGRRAFEGQSQASVIAAILDHHPPAVSALQPLVPRALDRVVTRCLAKDPDERCSSRIETGSVTSIASRQTPAARRNGCSRRRGTSPRKRSFRAESS
jgi:serine/threonine protein kinase